MTFRTNARAMLTIASLAMMMTGCEHDVLNPDTSHGEGATVGAIQAALTLPDDSVITDVAFNITGPGGFSRVGNIPVGNSTILTFRIGNIPVAPGYSIALSATTGFGNACAGSAPFDILNNQSTMVSVLLVCGATDSVGDLIVNGDFQSCPVITAITAIPGETTLGNAVALSSLISHGSDPVVWSGTGGTFGTPTAYNTSFTCVTPGPKTLTVMIDTTDCHDARTVDVICTLGAGCGNGVLDAGEGCDDGNILGGDTCSPTCSLNVCGDGDINPAAEACDDSNSITETCAYGTGACTVCNSVCQSVPGVQSACGDNVINGSETCDDGNVVTETCAYGTGACSVCNSVCQSIAGATSSCGDGIVNGSEACDAGPAGSAACSTSCTVLVDTCPACRAASCTNYQGALNVVAGCLDAGATGAGVRSPFVAAAFSAAQVQACVDVTVCARANNCAYNPANRVNPCYCGNIAVDVCNVSGPLAGQPCTAYVKAAVGDTVATPVSNTDTLLRMSDLGYPMGWAYFLLECDGTQCDGAAAGDCTP